MSEPQFCMSCEQEFVPTPERECQCIGCDALGQIANLEEDAPETLRIDDVDEICTFTAEDAEYQGVRRGRAEAATIARGAFDEIRTASRAKYPGAQA